MMSEEEKAVEEKAVAYLKRTLVELGEVRRRLHETERRVSEPIAIVGMGCRYPGGVHSPEDLWKLVSEGREGLSPLPKDRGWELESICGPDPDDPNATFRGGFLEGFAELDNEFFGISADEALLMDPQQRLLLEIAWEACEDANLKPTSLRGKNVGTFVGLSVHTYGSWLLGAVREGPNGYYASGNSGSMASGRLAHILGLEGPAVTIDTACSSSAVALHLACQSLRATECDLAITGGTTVMSTPWIYVEYARQPTPLFSPQGRCRSFSADADGTVFSEGVGVLVLERLSDAQRFGHEIHGVIRGSAVNQDGASNGLAAPNGMAHERVIRKALASSGVSPGEVDAVEAHGMGTVLGDPIEAQALLATYGGQRGDGPPLWLGSLKSNIGNTQAASAMAGIIKMVMAMKHGRLPKTLHVSRPSPYVDWESGAVSLLVDSVPWKRTGSARRAAVHSFGWSGTNVHIILEEPPSKMSVEASSDERPRIADAFRVKNVGSSTPVAWPVSGRGEDGLRRQAQRLAKFVEEHPEISITDVGYSLAVSRDQLSHRCVLVGTTRDEMLRALYSIANHSPDCGVVEGMVSPGRNEVVFFFSGGRWQESSMTLGDSSPAFGAEVTRIDEVLSSSVEWSLRDILNGDVRDYEDPGVAAIVDFAVQAGIVAIWRSCGVEPAVAVGDGPAEIIAAYIAGRITLSDAVHAAMTYSRDESVTLSLTDTGIPIWSTTAGEEYKKSEITLRALAASPHEPSMIEDVAHGFAAHGYRAFVEVCPSPIVPPTLRDTAVVVSGSQAYENGLPSLLSSLAQLWVSGINVDWAAAIADADAVTVPLPTYAFARTRYWVEHSPVWQMDGIMLDQDSLGDEPSSAAVHQGGVR